MEMVERFLEEVETLPQMFYNTVHNFGERQALKYRVDGNYVTLDYHGFSEVVEDMSNGLLSLGLRQGDRVCLMAHSSAKWIWSDFAVMTAGGVTVTVYPTFSAEEILYIVNHSESRFLIAGNEEIADKVRSVWGKMPSLEKIVVLHSYSRNDEENVISFDALREKGREFKTANPDSYNSRWQGLQGNDPCSLIYSSGTTGGLKGSLFTHKDIIQAIGRSLKHMITGGYTATYNDVAFSILPLSHVWERNDSYLTMVALGGSTGFGEKPATLIQDIQAVKPTWVLMVPRLWDRIYLAFRGAFTSTPLIKELFEWSEKVGEKVLAKHTDANGLIDFTVDPAEGLDEELKADFLKADEMVYSQLRQFLGGRLRIPHSGAGLLSPDLHRSYLLLNFPLLNGWGLTETAAGISHSFPNAVKIGWLSPMVPGVEAKLDEDGEILVKGIGVIKEYYKNEQETATAFTDDGWFRTGDIGEFDNQGFLRFVDRKKDILVLDTGLDVAPAKIISKFADSPYIEQVVVVGNDRKFISALVVPSYDLVLYMMEDREIPFDESRVKYAKLNGTFSCIEVGSDVIQNPFLQELINSEINRVNEQLNDYETIKRYTILPCKFTEARSELTPTLKIRNQVVLENYKQEIEKMYK